MVVFYYTSVAYLDIALEVINAIKKAVELHVVIEIAPESRATNILNVRSLDGLPTLASPDQVLDEVSLPLFETYFRDLASIHFFVQKNPKTFSYGMYRDCRELSRYIHAVSPGIIHFDTAKARALGLLPALYARYRRKVFITIHDPLPHSGEFNWRNVLVKKGFFPLAARFIFYSQFSETIFRQVYPQYSKKTAVVGMHPYSFYRNYLPPAPVERKTILFFGRISPYKGVDIFLKAIPLVLQQFPAERFVIAGAKGESYSLDASNVKAAGNQLELLLHHIPNDKLVELAAGAKLVVCPYRDATQSGVLMTAFACSTGVIASDVGAFPEFIDPAKNGMLCKADDAEALAKAIIESLQSGSWRTWSDQLKNAGAENEWLQETVNFEKIYKQDN